MSTLDFYDLFTTYTELKFLHIYGCSIDIWPNLTAAYKLEYLNINSNKITSLLTTIGLPQSNTVFRELHMGGNSFSISFLPQFLSSLQNLRILGLWNTGATVWPNVSNSIGNLRYLNIESNPLYTINTKLLCGIDNFTSPELPPGGYPLRDLYLGNIRLSIFPDVMFALFPNLQVLRISSNDPLSNVPNFTLIHSTLRHLEMQSIGRTENSPYPTFDYTTIFRQMTRMTLLYMYTNNLQQFPFPSAEYIGNTLPCTDSTTCG